MACNCIKATTSGRRVFLTLPNGEIREVTGLHLSGAGTMGARATGLALPMIGLGVLGGGIVKLTGASWLVAGGVALGFPIAAVLALTLASRSGSSTAMK